MFEVEGRDKARVNVWPDRAWLATMPTVGYAPMLLVRPDGTVVEIPHAADLAHVRVRMAEYSGVLIGGL